MQSSIQGGSGQARNPPALLRFPISSAAALRDRLRMPSTGDFGPLGRPKVAWIVASGVSQRENRATHRTKIAFSNGLSEGWSSDRNRLESISRVCMASWLAIKADATLTGTPPKSTWLVPETVVLRPRYMFLLYLPSCGSRCRQSPVNPLCPLGFRRRCAGTSRIAVFAPKPPGFNVPGIPGLACP